MTPLKSSILFQSQSSIDEILKECTNSKQFFVTYEDTKILISEESQFVNNALDQIFKQTQFTTILGDDDYIGEIKEQKSCINYLFGNYTQNKEIWIESDDRVLDFDVVKSDYLVKDAEEPKKIEYLTLSYPINDEKFIELIQILNESSNPEVFRS